MVGSWERAYGAPAAAAALTANGGCRRFYGEAYGGAGNSSESDVAMAAEETSGERLARDLWLYGGTTLVACGTVGYALLLSVAACSRRARSLRCAAFVVVLSLAGVARLYTGLLSTLVRHQTCHRVAFAAIASDVGCRLGAAAHYLAAQAHAWMQMCLAADGLRSGGATAVHTEAATQTAAGRCGSLCCCSGGRGRGCRVPPAAVIAGALILLLACLDAVPFVAYGQDTDGMCAPLQPVLAASWRYAHFALYFALPATAMVASHVAVCWRGRSRGRRPNGGGGVRSVDEKKAAGRESALGAATLALNVTFVLTAAPDAFISLTTPDDSNDGTMELIRCAFGLLAYAGCAAPFALCAAVGFKYRKALETTARASPKSDGAERCDCDHCGSGGNNVRKEQQREQQSRSLALHACCLRCRHDGGSGGNDSGERMQPVAPADGPPAATAAASDSVC